jgi:hypothetical protein
MKVLIIIFIGFLVVGCGVTELKNTTENVIPDPIKETNSPQSILKNLSQVQLSFEDQRSGSNDAHRIQIRRVIHHFEELSSMGTNALPVIEKFFSHKMDFEYRENAAEIASGNWSQGRIYLDPIFPPTLRIGLLNTVRHIGKRDVKATAAAERVLLDVLKTTRRAIEVIYIAQALEDLSPEVNKEAYLQVTRNLLSLPILEEGSDVPWLDRQYRAMLFNILLTHKDTRFVDQAKTQLVHTAKQRGTDGVEIEVKFIDRSVLGYLKGVLGSRSMSFLRDVYDNAGLDDRGRAHIRSVAADYMGISVDADIIVNSRIVPAFQALAIEVADAKKQKENRDRALSTIRYYLTRLGEGRNVPVETLQARQRFLSSLRTQTADKEVLGWMDNTQQRLNDMSDPEKAKKLDSRFDPRPSRR